MGRDPVPGAGAGPAAAEPPAPIPVLEEREGLVVVAKPAGISTEELLGRLRAQFEAVGRAVQLQSVSRLDKQTSGAIVIATSSAGNHWLTAQFADHTVGKRYLCLCTGRVEPPVGEVCAKLRVFDKSDFFRVEVSPHGKPAHTTYRRVEVLQDSGGDEYSLMEVQPVSGRTHQIRVHMQSIGHPLVGDTKYNPHRAAKRHLRWCPRLFLHAAGLTVLDMQSDSLTVSQPLPPDLEAVLSSLRHHTPGPNPTADGERTGSPDTPAPHDLVAAQL